MSESKATPNPAPHPESLGVSVQYGCGLDAADGWLNFDSSITLRVARTPIFGNIYLRLKSATPWPKTVMYGDIIQGLPLEPETVDRLYASHVLEHLTYDGAIRALANSFRILKPNGVFRLIVPDLYARAQRYVLAKQEGESDAAHDFMTTTYLGQRAEPRSAKDKLSAVFGRSRHLWMWDELSMGRALAEAGFISIRRCQFGDSNDAMFAKVENLDRFIDDDIIELAMECRKPT